MLFYSELIVQYESVVQAPGRYGVPGVEVLLHRPLCINIDTVPKEICMYHTNIW